MSQAELVAALPEAHRRHLDPSGPAPARMMAARGLVPLPPRELVIVLAGLALDNDAALAEAARASLVKLPDKIYAAAMRMPLPTAALGPLALALAGRDEPLEKLIVARETPDTVVALVASTASEKIAEIIASDQQRLLRSHELVASLRVNPLVLRSSIDRVFDFLVRSGVMHEDMPETGEALARLSPAEFAEVADKVELPPELQPLLADNSATADDAVAEAAAEALAATLDAELPEAEKKARMPLLKLVATLNVAQKIALAIKGNREARTLMVRDSNRMVAVAAIRSPRLTEQEARTVAGSRTVHDDVIRVIINSREMTRSYGVKLALAGNPKTPLPMAMKLLPLLRDADIKIMAKSKSVSSAIATQAKRMIAARSSGKQ